MGMLPAGRGFRALPLASRYVPMFLLSHSGVFLVRLTYTFFDSGQILMGLSIAPPLAREEWRPSLQQVTMGGGESELVVVRPSPLGVVPS